MTNRNSLSRRALLTGAAAAALGGTTGVGFARAPITNRPAPGFYRFKVGAFEATIVSDGPLNLGPLKSDIFKGISKEEMTKVFTDNFLPTENTELDQNALVINTGRNLVLFDTGVGKGLKAFGPNTGRLLANLASAGISPKQIDVVMVTHAHPDHCFGLLTERGERIFPRARIFVSQADFEFWTNEANAANDMLKQMIAGARRQLLPNRSRITFFNDGEEVVPGIRAIATPGHTVGHASFMISSGNQSLCNIGDIAHHHIISTERPRAEFAFDTDGEQAVASRLRMFDMLAADRIPMVAYHFPWPGLGYVAKQGNAYRYHPAALRTVM
jgi:glyoxylase-like metal-dependent hydrolase (beta-lactamase superfamily II)